MEEKKSVQNFVRIRGLPFSAGESDVRTFFEGLTIAELHLIPTADGRNSGEAYVEFTSADEALKGIAKHQQPMGSRYIEVFPIKDADLKYLAQKQTANDAGYVRIRGLPYSCKREDLDKFFSGVGAVGEVVFGKEGGEYGRPTGEALVRFDSKELADKAVSLNGQFIGNRYLELFPANSDAFETFKRRMLFQPDPTPGPGNYPLAGQAVAPWDPQQWNYFASPQYAAAGYGYGYGNGNGYYGYGYEAYGRRGGGGGGAGGGGQRGGAAAAGAWSGYGYRYSPYDYHGRNYGQAAAAPYQGLHENYSNSVEATEIYMRGVPFRVTAAEIEHFFSPLPCAEIKVGCFEDGRASGDAIVTFNSIGDARQALERDRQMIGARYIELFSAANMKVPGGTKFKSIGGKGRPNYQAQQAYQQGQQAAAGSSYQWSSAY